MGRVAGRPRSPLSLGNSGRHSGQEIQSYILFFADGIQVLKDWGAASPYLTLPYLSVGARLMD